MRLFIAIELPDDLKMALGGLRIDIPGARWVPAEQIHLTLAFLGEVEDTFVERLSGKLASIQVPAFELCFSGAGCFPNRRRPRVLWIGLEPEAHLNDLASRVREAVLTCGIPPRRNAPSLRILPWRGSGCHLPGRLKHFSISTKNRNSRRFPCGSSRFSKAD